VEIENVENVCRLCLSTDGPRSSVFATQEEKEDSSDVPLTVKIQACLSIQVCTRVIRATSCGIGIDGIFSTRGLNRPKAVEFRPSAPPDAFRGYIYASVEPEI